jgi:diguanylate cyclase (GGDEF)-like protein
MNDQDNKNKEALLLRINELEAQVHELEKDLIHDSLTGLKTRGFFEEESKIYLDMVRNISAGKRKEWFGFKNISFLFIDIDHFKQINDKYGHDAGDIVLKQVADTIGKSMREGDTVARWGGEEIVTSLLGANENDAKSKAENIRKEVTKLKFERFPELAVTISVGVVSSAPKVDFEELLRRADQAMYFSKQNGRDRVTTYSAMAK